MEVGRRIVVLLGCQENERREWGESAACTRSRPTTGIAKIGYGGAENPHLKGTTSRRLLVEMGKEQSVEEMQANRQRIGGNAAGLVQLIRIRTIPIEN
jgi:hypothetical protein